MFMPEPARCLQAIGRTLKPNASLALARWAQPERNPAFTVMTEVMSQFSDIPKPAPGAPGMFAMGDPEYLRSTLEAGGFNDIEIEDIEVRFFSVQNRHRILGADFRFSRSHSASL